MLSLKIKSYKEGQQVPEFHFFVLCKGDNSGRPSLKPNANCFIVSAATKEEADHLFWISYALWKGRGFHQHLRGSVIPFITAYDYKRVLMAAYEKTTAAEQALDRVVAIMKELDKKEAAAREQIKLLGQMRQLVLRKYIPG